MVLAGFIVVERRAVTPVLPLRLFADRAFVLSSVVGLSVGFALFGSVAYMPMFLQVARGSSPTASGLEMMPMMIGMLGASIASGQWISRTGRYKLFPVVGMGLVVAALTLLARLTADITLPALIVRLLLLGVGLGLVMQVLVLAVQNAVPYADLGAATSSAMLFRLVGGAMGTAVLGVIFASSLHPGAGSATQAEAITGAMRNVFTAAAVVAAVGAILTWFLPERPLRDTVAATAGVVGYESGEAFAMTARDDSQDALVRGLSILAARDVRRAFIQGIVDRAGVQLMPISAWLLIRLGEDAGADLVTLAAERGVTRPARGRRHHRAPCARFRCRGGQYRDAGRLRRVRTAERRPAVASRRTVRPVAAGAARRDRRRPAEPGARPGARRPGETRLVRRAAWSVRMCG